MLKKKKAILFIDEIHTLVGAGSSGGGTLDASNLLKPMLTSGKIRCIGSTTYEEYNKYFEKDHALSRRFQKIDIVEPSVTDTIAILHGLKRRYEDFHAVTYTDEAIEQAVTLSDQYITERRLPDKAIDIIDEAGAKARILAGPRPIDSERAVTGGDAINGEGAAAVGEGAATPERIVPVIDRALVETVVAKIARIPERTVTTNETERLRELESVLSGAIFGQDAAIVITSYSIHYTKLYDADD